MYSRCFLTCRDLTGALRKLYPEVQFAALPKFGTNGEFSTIGACREFPETLTIEATIPFLVGEQRIYRKLCVDIPGEEIYHSEGRYEELARKYCTPIAALMTSPSALQPSTRSNFQGELLGARICSDSPICLFDQNVGSIIEFVRAEDAFAAYLIFSTQPGFSADSLHILEWNNGRWTILAPESFLTKG
jgi:hypothetical protein